MIRHLIRSRRVLAAGIHLFVSASVAAVAALVVFLLWFPPPYAAISGGLSLFVLLVSVDVVLGPALTAIAASPSKPARELRRDLAVIVAIQLAAFAYGIHAIALARPVVLSFEVDRMRVVTAADIEEGSLMKAPASLRKLSWSGPVVIAAVKPTDPDEVLRSIQLGLAGTDLSMIPGNWREFESQHDAAWLAARPVARLLAQYPRALGEVDAAASGAGVAVQQLRFLPVLSRRASWVALVAPASARVVGFLPLDGFF